MSLLDHMCPKCDYYMPLTHTEMVQEDGSGSEKKMTLVIRYCRNCGYNEEEKKGLVMETIIQGQSSESYKTFVNEYTKTDPRLPHVKTLKCPNEVCASRTGSAEPDVIYIKYDTANLKCLYMCNVCDTQWRSGA